MVTDLEGWFARSLQCPACAAALTQRGDRLECESGHSFAVIDGVPVLVVVDEPAQVAEQHKHQREFYDQVYGSGSEYSLQLWQRAYVERLKPLWDASPDAPFLDVGAGGDAYTVVEAARLGLRAIGCDLSVEAMRRARRLALAEGLEDRCGFVVCMAERLPFAAETFGSAAAVHVLEHLTDDDGALIEFARVTKRGAKVFIGVPNTFDKMPALLRPVYRWHDRRIGHLRQYSASRLEAQARAAGFNPSRLTFSAHWIKVWQLMLHLAAERVHINDEKLWWWLERIDASAGNRDNGLHLNLFLERS